MSSHEREVEDIVFMRLREIDKLRNRIAGQAPLDKWDYGLLAEDRASPLTAVRMLARRYRLSELYILSRLRLISDTMMLEALSQNE